MKVRIYIPLEWVGKYGVPVDGRGHSPNLAYWEFSNFRDFEEAIFRVDYMPEDDMTQGNSILGRFGVDGMLRLPHDLGSVKALDEIVEEVPHHLAFKTIRKVRMVRMLDKGRYQS